jgi:hypothetical protein
MPNDSAQFGAAMTSSQHAYEVRPRKDHRGVNLIFDALPFGRLWYDGPQAVSNAIGYAEHRSRSQGAVIRVYDCRMIGGSIQPGCCPRSLHAQDRVAGVSSR